MQKFAAKIHKLGINPCVDVPGEIVSALLDEAKKRSAPVQVKGTLNGVIVEANVVKYSGNWRLYLNTQIRKDAGIEVGDTAHITLVNDPAPRMPPTPQALKAALAEDKRAKDAWRLQPSSRRKEILAYLNSLKTQEALIRNIKKVIKYLLDKNTKDLEYLVRQEKRY